MIMHVSRRRSAVTSAVVTYANAQIINASSTKDAVLKIVSIGAAHRAAAQSVFGNSNEVEIVAFNRPLRCAQLLPLISKHYFVD